MDFLDPKKRKAHRIKLFIGYGLMAIALGFATTIVLYQAYGYDYNARTGEVVQNGFVFVNAAPVTANIFLNGQNRGQTDTRIDTPAGEYSLELQANGYRNWKRDFSLEGGKIQRLTYPFLFPNDLKTTDIQLFASRPSLVTQSLDRKWLLTSDPANFQSFNLIDTTASTPIATTISLPTGLIKNSGSNHNFELGEWATDNRHVLLKHIYDGGQEYVLVDTETPASSINVSNTLAVAGQAIALRDKKYDQYYIYNTTDKSLKTANLSNKTGVLYLSDVLAFKSHGSDVMAFVTAVGASEGKVWLKIREGDGVYSLRQVPTSDNYLVDIARYENSWYVAGGSTQDQRVYIFKNPVAASKRDNNRLPVPVAVLRSAGVPTFLSFSENTQFIALQNGKEFSVYDAETDRQYRYDSGLSVDPANKALWMDGHRLSLVAGQKVNVFDFDGTNKQELSPALENAQVYYDQNWQNMLTLAPSLSVSGRLAITRTSLRVNL